MQLGIGVKPLVPEIGCSLTVKQTNFRLLEVILLSPLFIQFFHFGVSIKLELQFSLNQIYREVLNIENPP